MCPFRCEDVATHAHNHTMFLIFGLGEILSITFTGVLTNSRRVQNRVKKSRSPFIVGL